MSSENENKMDLVVDKTHQSWFDLPPSWRQVQVIELSKDFQQATSLQNITTYNCGDDEVIVRMIYAGVNASDVNFTAGKYFGNKDAAKRALPFAAGLEGVGIVVKSGKRAATPIGSTVAAMESGKFHQILEVEDSKLTLTILQDAMLNSSQSRKRNFFVSPKSSLKSLHCLHQASLHHLHCQKWDK